MIIYGCMNGKLKNNIVDDISTNKSHSILKEKNINIKLLPGYGNLGLKKRYIKPYVENEKCSIKLKDYYVTLFKIKSVNFLCVNCFNNSFNCMYLSLLGFNAWYLWLFIFTIYALLLVLFKLLCDFHHIQLMK